MDYTIIVCNIHYRPLQSSVTDYGVHLPTLDEGQTGCIHLQKYAKLEKEGLQRVQDWLYNSFSYSGKGMAQKTSKEVKHISEKESDVEEESGTGSWWKEEYIPRGKWPDIIEKDKKVRYYDVSKTAKERMITHMDKKLKHQNTMVNPDMDSLFIRGNRSPPLKNRVRNDFSDLQEGTMGDSSTKLLRTSNRLLPIQNTQRKHYTMPSSPSELQCFHMGMETTFIQPRSPRLSIEPDWHLKRLGDSMLHGKSALMEHHDQKHHEENQPNKTILQ